MDHLLSKHIVIKPISIFYFTQNQIITQLNFTISFCTRLINTTADPSCVCIQFLVQMPNVNNIDSWLTYS